METKNDETSTLNKAQERKLEPRQQEHHKKKLGADNQIIRKDNQLIMISWVNTLKILINDFQMCN